MPTNLASWVTLVAALMLACALGRGFARSTWSQAVQTAFIGVGGVVMTIVVALPELWWSDGIFLRVPVAIVLYGIFVYLDPHPKKRLVKVVLDYLPFRRAKHA